MTALDEPTTAAAPFVPSTHPVRWATLALLLAVAVLTATWWSGAFATRVAVPGTSGRYDHATGIGEVTIDIENEAPLGFEVVEASIEAPGVRTLGAEVDGVPMEAAGTVAGGADATLTIRYVVEGCPDVPPGPQWRLQVSSRTPVGGTQGGTFDARRFAPATPCSILGR